MGQSESGTRDVAFDIVSVLYHALQAAHTCTQYRQDSEEEGDRELVQFFDEVISANRSLAQRAKELLSRRLSLTHQQLGAQEAVGESPH